MNRKILANLVCGIILAGYGVSAQEMRNQTVVYTCPMDPEVKSEVPGVCPKCGMKLRAAKAQAEAATARNPVIPNRQGGRVEALRLPDTVVYDQDGRRLRFYTDLVKGKTVAINFIFTTCTTICPPLAATFRKVQKELGERLERDVRLISVSVDPAVDIPARLKSFGAKFGATAGWTFVTGDPGDIDKLLEALGAAVANKNDHTPMILVGNDAARYWTRANGLSPAPKLVSIIAEVAARKPSGKSE